MAKEERVFVPTFKNLPPPDEYRDKNGRKQYDHSNKGPATNKNIGRYFVQLDCFLNGGKPNAERSGRRIVYGSRNGQDTKYFCPDIKYDGWIDTRETKAMSRKRSRPTCRIGQLENAVANILLESESGNTPRHTYSIFLYGRRSSKFGFRKKSKSQTVRLLSETQKSQLIFPLPLALFVYSMSRHETMDHKRSNFGQDSQTYWGLPLSIFEQFFKSDTPTEALRGHGRIYVNGKKMLSRDAFLDRMWIEHSMSSEIPVEYYGAKTTIPPFPIAEVKMTVEDSRDWIIHFAQNHGRILRTPTKSGEEGLALSNVYRDRKEFLVKRQEKFESVPATDLPF